MTMYVIVELQCGCIDLLLVPEPPLAVEDNSFHLSDITLLVRLPL